MKYILFLLIALANCHNLLNAQCEVDAGETLNLCPAQVEAGPTLNGQIISGEITATRWTASYSYTLQDKEFNYSSSDMLMDSTKLAAEIKDFLSEKSQLFYLTATSKDGTECTDSILVNYSRWSYVLTDRVIGKDSSTDTVTLWTGAESNWGNASYQWSPDYRIADTQAEKPQVWNDTTMIYYETVTDSLGCTVDAGPFTVNVLAASARELAVGSVTVFPNPATNLMSFESPYLFDTIRIYNLQGQLVFDQPYENQVAVSELPAGTYILQLVGNDGLYTIKFVKE